MQNQLSWWTSALAFMMFLSTTGCQARTDDNPPLARAATPGRSVVVQEAGVPPVPTPEQQIGISGPNRSEAPFPYELTADFGPAAYGKLSGIVFYPPRKTLMAVSDNGHISEIATDGTLIQRKQTRKKADFEGITYHPATERLYVAIEGEEIILEVNPHTLAAERDIPIDRLFEGEILLSPEGDGIEGITFVPAGDEAMNGSFYLVNQSNTIGGPDPSVVFEVTIDQAANASPKARITRYFTVGITDLSGIDYLPKSGHLLIISDANDLLIEVSLTGEVLASYALPGKAQEGVTIDEHGVLYIAQDTKEALRKFIAVPQANGTKAIPEK
jgi:uncharacterized protein YjiK